MIAKATPDQREELRRMAAGISDWNNVISSSALELVEGRAETAVADRMVGLSAIGLDEGFAKPGENFDLDDMGNYLAGRSESFRAGWAHFNGLLRDGWSSEKFAQGRAEHLYDGMDASQFGALLMQCQAVTLMERCPASDYNVVLDCLGTMDVGCTETEMRIDPYFDYDFDCPAAEDEPRKMVGANSPVWSRIPKRNMYRIGTAMKESLRCNGLMGLLESAWVRDSRRPWDRAEAKRAVAYMLGGCCGSTCGVNGGVYYDQCKFPLYMDGSTPGPHCNKMYLNTDLTACDTEAMICEWEERLSNACDPFTGEIVDCCPNGWTVITFGSKCNAKAIQKGLGAHTVEHGNACTDGLTCTQSRTYQEAARARFGEVKQHAYFTRFAFEHRKKCYGEGTTMNFTDEQIQQMVDRTFLIGCPQMILKRTIEKEFTRSQFGGTNTWAYFNQGVESFHGIDVKTGLAAMPTMLNGLLLVEGLPDGVEPGSLVCG
jgi:hypothetical protein